MVRIINFEGRRISVPDDTTDDEVRQVLSTPVEPSAPTSFRGNSTGCTYTAGQNYVTPGSSTSPSSGKRSYAPDSNSWR